MSRGAAPRGRAAGAWGAALACVLVADLTVAQVGGRPLSTRVEITPAAVKLGERVTYRAVITGGWTAARIRVLPPVTGGDLTWGVAMGRHRNATGERTRPDTRGWYESSGGGDSLVMEVPLQVFRPGMVSIPGPRVEVVDRSGARALNLPMVTLVVVPVVGATDSTADLRPLRGPLPAPWWERVPWRWVALGLLAAALAIALVRWLRRRRPAPAVRPAAASRSTRDPLAEGLAALAALRAERLPAAGPVRRARLPAHAHPAALPRERGEHDASG